MIPGTAPEPLARAFLDAWAHAKGVPSAMALPADELLRVERALRLPGPWSVDRVRAVLAACLVRSEEDERRFEAVAASFFHLPRSPEESARAYDGTGRALAAVHDAPPPPPPPPKPLQPAVRPVERATWALGAVLLTLAVVALINIGPPEPVTTTVTPPERTRVPPCEPWPACGDVAPTAVAVPYVAFRGAPRPAPPSATISRGVPRGLTWLSPVGLLIAGTGWMIAAFTLRDLRRRTILPPDPRRRAPGRDGPPLRLQPDRPPAAWTLPADALDRLAEAVGSVRELPSRPDLDVAASVRATAREAGVPSVVWAEERRLQPVVVLCDRAAPLRAERDAARALAEGLARRGVPVETWGFAGRPDRVRQWGGVRELTLDRLAQGRHDTLWVVVGQAEHLAGARGGRAPGPTVADLAGLGRVAWVELDLAPSPASRGIARSLPAFPADGPGVRALAGWVAAGRRGPFPPRAPTARVMRLPDSPGERYVEMGSADAGLDADGRARAEARFGPALVWVAALALCPLPCPPDYALRLRERLAALAAASGEPGLARALDALAAEGVGSLRSAWTREDAQGFTFAAPLRDWLVREVLPRRFPWAHGPALAWHREALARAEVVEGTTGGITREVADALLAWEEAHGHGGDAEARRDAARRLWQARGLVDARGWIDRWTRPGPVPGLPEPNLTDLDEHARREVVAARTGLPPRPETDAHAAAALAAAGAFFLGTWMMGLDWSLSSEVAPVDDPVVFAGEPPEDWAWMSEAGAWGPEGHDAADPEAELTVRVSGWPLGTGVKRGDLGVGDRVTLTPADPVPGEGCIDTESIVGATILRCVPGYAAAPRASDVRGTVVTLPPDEDGAAAAMARVLLLTGNAQVVGVGLGRWDWDALLPQTLDRPNPSASVRASGIEVEDRAVRRRTARGWVRGLHLVREPLVASGSGTTADPVDPVEGYREAAQWILGPGNDAGAGPKLSALSRADHFVTCSAANGPVPCALSLAWLGPEDAPVPAVPDHALLWQSASVEPGASLRLAPGRWRIRATGEGVTREADAVVAIEGSATEFRLAEPVAGVAVLTAPPEGRRATRGAAPQTDEVQTSATTGPIGELLVAYERFNTIKWSKSESKNAELMTKTKPKQLEELLGRSEQLVAADADYDTRVAVLYIQGMAHFAYADMAYDYPPPKGLYDEQLDLFQQLVDDKIGYPARERGRKYLMLTLDLARNEKRWSEWNTKALAELHERYPHEFQREPPDGLGAPPLPEAPVAPTTTSGN